MQAVYLIRHGAVKQDGDGSRCVGRTELDLSPEGEEQARALGRLLAPVRRLHWVSSPLLRCRRTACLAGCPDVPVDRDLREVDTGAWDGLPFEEIRRRWPEEYRRRGEDLLGTPPPGGESFLQCRTRAAGAFQRLRERCPTGDLAVVAHSGVGRMLISALTGMPGEEALKGKLPYGSVTLLLLSGERAFLGPTALPEELPHQTPDEGECHALLREYGTPPHVIDHCKAVAEEGERLCAGLEGRGVSVDPALVRAGALLHDIARTQPHHGEAGALWLLKRGYGQLSALVGDHMALPEEEAALPTEKAVVFLADKLVRETGQVTLEQRYFQRCTPEKQPFVREKYLQAKRVRDLLAPEIE